MDQYSREFIAEKARLRPEDLGLVRTARRSHNQLGLAYQIAFIRLTGRAPGQQPFEILEDLVGYVATELNANPRDRGSDSNGAKSHVKGRCWDRLASQDLSPSVSQGTIWRYVAVDRRLGYA